MELSKIKDEMERDLVYSLDVYKFTRLFWAESENPETSTESDYRDKARYEAIALQLVPRNGYLNPLFIPAGISEETARDHAISQFDNAALDYLCNRLEETTNYFLRARYAHILWLSSRKHQRYATIAIDSYLTVAKRALSNAVQNPTEKENQLCWGQEAVANLLEAFFLATALRHKSETIAKEIYDVLLRYSSSTESYIYVVRALVELIVGNQKPFESINWEPVSRKCLEATDYLQSEKRFDISVDLLHLGKRADNIGKLKTIDWDNAIAVAWEKAIDVAGENMLGCDFCRKAIEAYKLVGNVGKIEQLSTRFESLRKSIKFSAVEYKYDSTDFINRCKSIVDTLSRMSSAEVLKYLCFSPDTLPSSEGIRVLSKETYGNSLFGSFVSVHPFDERGNSNRVIDESNKEQYFFWETYRLAIKNISNPLIHMILDRLVQNDTITAESVTEEFTESSWIHHLFSFELPSNQKVDYRWVEVIRPIIETYFEARKAKDVELQFRLMMHFIDSAVTKIEGILRDLASLNGISTTRYVIDRSGRGVEREKDIDTLLRETKLCAVIGEDLANFLRFTLVEQGGFKLRHRVAHTLLFPQEYQKGNADTLFLALLRLIPFVIVNVNECNSH